MRTSVRLIASPRPFLRAAKGRGALLLIVLAVSGAAGCGFFKSLAGTNTVDLSDAQIKSMRVDIRKQQKTICPRERVQMAVFAEVVFEGESKVESVETWEGQANASKNERLDFAEFAFRSPHGSFDDMGWFTPSRDLRTTAGTEFELTTAYKRQPDRFTFQTTYRPDYKCIQGAKASGVRGDDGSSGNTGQHGTEGRFGSDTARGGDGSNGARGGSGRDGAPGGDGPAVRVFATMVKTPFYERLVAVKVEGGMQDFVLAHPAQKLVIGAIGGLGGDGGNGGDGGSGGRGGSGNPAGSGANGGDGGNGGNGGHGGRGGSVELVFDARFPELARRIELDVRGGAGGKPGAPGAGGRGGAGGSSLDRSAMGSNGDDGIAGSMGATGRAGHPGTASAQPGDVASSFADLPGVTLL